MTTRYFNFHFTAGSNNYLSKLIKGFDELKRGVSYSLKKVNSKELLIRYKDAIMDKLNNFNVRYGSRMDKILDGFTAKKRTKNNISEIEIDYTKNTEFTYQKQKIDSRSIIKLLDSGRKSYVIPSTKNTSARPVLVWFYGNHGDKSVKAAFPWKRLRRRIHILKGKSKIYNKGTHMMDAGIGAINAYIEEIRNEIKAKMARN